MLDNVYSYVEEVRTGKNNWQYYLYIKEKEGVKTPSIFLVIFERAVLRLALLLSNVRNDFQWLPIKIYTIFDEKVPENVKIKTVWLRFLLK